jgi:hypothetical protein
MKQNKKQITYPILPVAVLVLILDYIVGGQSNPEIIQASAAIAAVAVSAVAVGVSAYQASKNREAAEDFSEQALAEQRKQQKILEKQKEEYKALEFKNPYAGLQNQFENMENVYEDLTVNQQQAEFQQQMFQQQQANVMDTLRGAAGGSGIAALAQTLSNQAQQQAAQASASIGMQESQLQKLTAGEAGRLQQQERSVDRQNQMLNLQGEQWIQQQEIGRQKTLLGMQMGETSGANMARQEAIANEQAVKLQGQQEIMSAVGSFGTAAGNLAGEKMAGGVGATPTGSV